MVVILHSAGKGLFGEQNLLVFHRKCKFRSQGKDFSVFCVSSAHARQCEICRRYLCTGNAVVYTHRGEKTKRKVLAGIRILLQKKQDWVVNGFAAHPSVTTGISAGHV